MQLIINTKDKGTLRFLMYKEGKEYIAVCLNLDIVEYGNNPNELWFSIQEAAYSYIEAVRKENLSDEYLNKRASQKFFDVVKKIKESEELRQSSISNHNTYFSKQPYSKNYCFS